MRSQPKSDIANFGLIISQVINIFQNIHIEKFIQSGFENIENNNNNNIQINSCIVFKGKNNQMLIIL